MNTAEYIKPAPIVEIRLVDKLIGLVENSDYCFIAVYPVLVGEEGSNYGTMVPHFQGCWAFGSSENIRQRLLKTLEFHVKEYIANGKSLPHPISPFTGEGDDDRFRVKAYIEVFIRW